MVEYKDIQNPEDFNEKDYQHFRYLLTSDDTPAEELEKICMTLAHLPTEYTKDLLEEFKTSERAGEVGWLECAIEENQFHLLMPENEKEERDFLALKMVGEKDDLILDLMCECDKHRLRIREYEIEKEALEKLLPQNPDLKYDISAIHDTLIWGKKPASGTGTADREGGKSTEANPGVH
ncbi:MAG TPA: hypothetical protein ENO00_06865 [Deltaproteobacteria bacterium]|nr:hypothetical protein [Deltaproteobacteria bacterium]